MFSVLKVLNIKILFEKNVNIILVLQKRLCGYYSKEDTPVPIPNTEVKLLSADGTWWATAWESKT